MEGLSNASVVEYVDKRMRSRLFYKTVHQIVDDSPARQIFFSVYFKQKLLPMFMDLYLGFYGTAVKILDLPESCSSSNPFL